VEDIYRRLGRSVRQRRLLLGWTQEELGEASGLHPSYIGQIERGIKKVSLRTLSLLAQAFGTTAGDILDEPDPGPRRAWEARIDALLRDKPSRQKAILYSTLRHLSRQLGSL